MVICCRHLNVVGSVAKPVHFLPAPAAGTRDEDARISLAKILNGFYQTEMPTKIQSPGTDVVIC